jgi:hypothetical protein
MPVRPKKRFQFEVPLSSARDRHDAGGAGQPGRRVVGDVLPWLEALATTFGRMFGRSARRGNPPASRAAADARLDQCARPAGLVGPERRPPHPGRWLWPGSPGPRWRNGAPPPTWEPSSKSADNLRPLSPAFRAVRAETRFRSPRSTTRHSRLPPASTGDAPRRPVPRRRARRPPPRLSTPPRATDGLRVPRSTAASGRGLDAGDDQRLRHAAEGRERTPRRASQRRS